MLVKLINYFLKKSGDQNPLLKNGALTISQLNKFTLQNFMKSFLNLTGLIILGITISYNSFAQKDFSAKLKKDIVTIEAGKYNATDYYYLKFTNGNTAQMKVSATCPNEVMSRDNFIGIFSSYSMVLLLVTFSESETGLPDIKDLDELI